MREAHVHAGLHVSAHTRETRLPTSRRLLWQQSHKCKRNTPVLKLIRLQIESAAGEHTPVIMPQHSREGGKYSLHATLKQSGWHVAPSQTSLNLILCTFRCLSHVSVCDLRLVPPLARAKFSWIMTLLFTQRPPLLRNIPHLIQYSIHS